MTLQRWREISSSTHIAGEKAWVFMPIRGTTERGYLEGNLERRSQTRPDLDPTTGYLHTSRPGG